ncbi:MAG TPA: RNA polymerase sigma factor [Ktedonobacteraceae bacterium]|jgi:RNA polymerase sigma-70 factor (ECF subfamily)|nr:RNA polymerase sigma factor [Ktedonobacteraceae bacterium]
MELNDHELLTLLAYDLRNTFQHLVIRYQQRLYSFARRLTASPQDAEDIVQEAFVGAYVSLENYAPQRVLMLKLQPWLYKVLLNVLNHHSRGARLHVVPFTISEEGPFFDIEDKEDERPEVLFENQERRQELEILLARLPERYRVAVICYYFEHLSYQEVADLLDQPLGTVKSNISRGIQQLRSILSTAQQEIEGWEDSSWQKKKSSERKA